MSIMLEMSFYILFQTQMNVVEHHITVIDVAPVKTQRAHFYVNASMDILVMAQIVEVYLFQ